MDRRNPEAFLAALRGLSKAYPERRLGQLLVTVLGKDPYYLDDEKAAELMWQYAKRNRPMRKTRG